MDKQFYLEKITESVPVALAYIGNDLRYRYINREYEIWFDCHRAEIIGQPITKVIGNAGLSRIQPHLNRVLSGEHVSFEIEMVFPGFGKKFVDVQYSPDATDSGEVVGICAAITNISRRKEMEKSATATKDLLYKTILDTLPGIYAWVSDKDGKLIYINQEWQHSTGLSTIDTRSGKWVDVIHPDDRATFQRHWQRSKIYLNILSTTVRFYTNQGYRLFDVKAVPITNPAGELEHWVGTSIDADEYSLNLVQARQKQTEERELRLAREKILVSASHEIRTPLAVIVGYLEYLKDNPDIDATELAEVIATAATSAQHLIQIVNNILDFAKLGSGTDIPVRKANFSLFDKVNYMFELFQSEAAHQGIELVNQVDPTLGVLNTDPNLVRQILVNLVSNALKFTKTGQIVVSASMVSDKKLCCLRVKDTGCGIPEDKFNVIFEPYGQVGSGSEDVRGTGLGLALSKEFAELLGGELVLESSRLGAGSVFKLLLPVDVATDSIAENEMLGSENTKLPKKCRVLVVDDCKAIQDLVKVFLIQMGAEVEAVSSAEEGLSLIERQKFDIVLLDINLSGMGGLKAIHRFKKIRRSMPVVAMTADVSKQQMEDCRRSGFDEFLPKPTSSRDLKKILLQFQQCGDG